ncbi:MAG: arylesterase [SAR324 cluster bacterium]|nr:arylesterase [SAR324 cluster bacterium]
MLKPRPLARFESAALALAKTAAALATATAALAIAAALSGCERKKEAQEPLPPAPQAEIRAPAFTPPPSTAPLIVALGDSLTAGFGLPVEQSYPAVLQERLRAEGYPHQVVNAGVSGDTTAGGLARLSWQLSRPVEVIVVALGANDGLRGLDTEEMRKNLAEIIEISREAGTKVVLAGVPLPFNYGHDFSRRFRAVYRELANRYDVALIPSLLEGVAGRRDLNLADGIHPNEKGARIVADNVWRALKPLLEK